MYHFAIIDPRRPVVPPSTLGIEVTIPEIAALCDLGNIDPQHGCGRCSFDGEELAELTRGLLFRRRRTPEKRNMTSAERVAARSYLHEFLLADPFPSDEEAEATLGDALDDEDRAVLALMRVAWFEPDLSGETDGWAVFADGSRLTRSDPGNEVSSYE